MHEHTASRAASGSSEITLYRTPHHHPSASGLLPAASKPAHAIAGLAIAHSSRPTHRQHHPFTSTPPQLRMVQRGPRPPHAQRIPRITRTQSPPRGRMCSVVPLALCARDTSCTCPPSLPLLKTHAACTSLTRCRVVFDPAARAWSLLLNSFAHHRFGDVGILRSSLLFSSLGGGRRGHLDALLLLLRRLDLLEQPVLWRREDLADE